MKNDGFVVFKFGIPKLNQRESMGITKFCYVAMSSFVYKVLEKFNYWRKFFSIPYEMVQAKELWWSNYIVIFPIEIEVFDCIHVETNSPRNI